MPGRIPGLKSGENAVSYSSDLEGFVKSRVQLTIMSEGKPLLN